MRTACSLEMPKYLGFAPEFLSIAGAAACLLTGRQDSPNMSEEEEAVTKLAAVMDVGQDVVPSFLWLAARHGPAQTTLNPPVSTAQLPTYYRGLHDFHYCPWAGLRSPLINAV